MTPVNQTPVEKMGPTYLRKNGDFVHTSTRVGFVIYDYRHQPFKVGRVVHPANRRVALILPEETE